MSQFKQTEKTKDAVLFIILDKLNKFAPKNYNDIYEFLCQILDDGQTAFLKDFMKVVFEKATQEEMFCAHYVRLLCELSVKYSILSKEMIERYKEYSALFSSLPTTLVAAPSDDEEDTLSEKKYFLGYSQFLAELVKYNVLNPDLFTETLQNIIGNIPVAARLPAGEGKRALETYVDCMLRILREIKTQQTPLATSLRAILKERFVTVLEPARLYEPRTQESVRNHRHCQINKIYVRNRYGKGTTNKTKSERWYFFIHLQPHPPVDWRVRQCDERGHKHGAKDCPQQCDGRGLGRHSPHTPRRQDPVGAHSEGT